PAQDRCRLGLGTRLCPELVPQRLQEPRLPGRTLVQLGKQFLGRAEVPYAVRAVLVGKGEMLGRVGIAAAALLRQPSGQIRRQVPGPVGAEPAGIGARRRCPFVRPAGFLQLYADHEAPNSDVAWPEVLP